MTDFGITLLLVALAFLIIALIEPLREVGNAIVRWLDGKEEHSRAQANSVLKHAGFISMPGDDDDE